MGNILVNFFCNYKIEVFYICMFRINLLWISFFIVIVILFFFRVKLYISMKNDIIIIILIGFIDDI